MPLANPLTEIRVAGFKSIDKEAAIKVANLTILAGANSSGKSSIMQPVLLMKQTLEATFDPGPLLLNGPNIKFTETNQLLFGKSGARSSDKFDVTFCYTKGADSFHFRAHKQDSELIECSSWFDNVESQVRLKLDMSPAEIERFVPLPLKGLFPSRKSRNGRKQDIPQWPIDDPEFVIRRNKCFLEVWVQDKTRREPIILIGTPLERTRSEIENVIHLPGLRGNPERTYPVTAVGKKFPGTFQEYTASIIDKWKQNRQGKGRLDELGGDLKRLGLTWKVDSHRSTAAHVELQVGRLSSPTQGGARDLVNIADVGFGVSQVLPVLVAIHEADEEHLLYFEQPEIHLHPKAQVKLAEVLADAAKRGVRMILETHSSLLLLSIQSLVAEQKLDPKLVALNWFERDSTGATRVTQASLDEMGRFGEDWPEDFGSVSLEAEKRYLDAVDKRHP